jgi:hypothetical protein
MSERLHWYGSSNRQLLVLLAMSGLPAAIVGANNPSPPSPGATDAASAPTAVAPPSITKNPDGTITIRRQPPKGNNKNGKKEKGLVIPPQVVTPTNPVHGKP